MRQTSIWSAAIFLALLAFPALASDFAGVVKTSRGVATIDRTGTKVPVVAGTRINQGDRIVTANNGYLGITMSDDTLLTLGPGSLLVIDAYGFDPKTHDGNFLASLTRGALSVVTGLIARRAPGSFVVKTRISTMGVRGTEFIVEANEL